MQVNGRRRVVAGECIAQEIGEEPVIAIPVPLTIQRDEEEIGAVEIVENVCRMGGWVVRALRVH